MEPDILNRPSNKKHSSTFKRLVELYTNYKLALGVTLLALIVFGSIDAGMLYLIKPLIDEGLNNSNPQILRIGSVLVVVIFTIRGFANFTSNYTANWISNHIIALLRQLVFSHLLKLPRSFYDKNSRGELVAKVIYDTEQIAKATSGAFISAVRESIILMVLVVLMFITSWHLSLVFLAIGPLIGILLFQVSRLFKQKSKNLQTSMGEISKSVEQAIKNHQEILSFTAEKYEQLTFSNINKQTRQSNMKLVLLSSLTNPVIQIVGSLAMALVLLIASFDSVIENISPGAFTATIVAMGSLLKPIKQLSKVNENIQSGLAAAESIFKLLDEPAELDAGTSVNYDLSKGIQFKQLNFSYSADQTPVLKQIDLDIKHGEVIAFVGISGSGKSTILDLLLRFYQAPKQSIYIGGLAIEDWPLADLRKQFSIVSQAVNLRAATLNENIIYGAEQVSNESERFAETEQLAKAIEDAQLKQFVSQNKHQQSIYIGEEGSLLSGGQKQRVAIARAVYRQSPILILDEATSALDQLSEEKFMSALKSIKRNKTVLMVGHRPAAIQQADRIVVMDQGCIVEIGTHQQLLANKGHYTSLFNEKSVITD